MKQNKASKRISFKIKVLIPIMAIFLVSVLVISVIDYRMLYSTVRKKTDANLEIFADNILAQINHLDIILESIKQTLNEKHIVIAKTIVHIFEISSYEMTPYELQRLAEPLDIIELNIADAEGNLVNSNIPSFIGDDYKTTDTTITYMALADGSLSQIAEEPRASILPDGSYGEITHFAGVARPGGGFVQLGFNASVIGRLQDEINIDKTIKETTIGDNGYGFVITSGIITAHPDNDLLNKNVADQQWYKDIAEGNGFIWINIDGKKYYAGFKNENNNTVVGLVPYRDYYRELNSILLNTVRFMILAIIILIAVVYLVLGKLLSPIKHLVKGLGKIADSRMEARIEGSYNDEFDEIKDAINSMASDIKAHMNMISGIEYASKIQKNMLPPESVFNEVFEDYSCIWKPKDIVGGDIYWIKNFEKGAVICICDCTGHGTPGALLTMLVSSIFETTVTDRNCNDTAQIIWELEKRLIAALNVNYPNKEFSINDGCDLAVLFIAKDGSVTISSGNTNVFICDGVKVIRLKGQKIRVGDGKLRSKDEIKVTTIPASEKNKYYIASDGLYEQVGGEMSFPFGYDTLERIILDNHNEKQSIISEKLWQAFETYRGVNARRDDFQLITFKPAIFSV
jgi:serine phosphatase RsbU (regulator of sigma subunit)